MRSRKVWVAFAASLGGTIFAAVGIRFRGLFPAIAWTLEVAAFFAGLALGLHGSRPAKLAGVALSLVPLVVTAINIAVGIARDPTSRNLFPFELFGAAVIGVVPAAGLAIGRAASRTRVAQRAALCFGACAALPALLSPAIGGVFNRRHEASAEDTLHRLLAAEEAYRAANPAHLYTCEGPQLPGFQAEHWYAWTQLGLTAKDHFVGPVITCSCCGAAASRAATTCPSKPARR
jgi:hypothetical protein